MSLGAETTADEVIDGIDLNGKTAVVTGASGGIGLEAARVFASAGARIVLAVRNAEKGDAAVATIRERVPDAQPELGSLDLTSLASVRSFADWFNSSHERLDLLINNAGVMASPFDHTADGFELQFGTNHLGHFLLTALLMPTVLASTPARIVNVSSAGHHGSDIVWDDINYERRPYDKWDAYGQSKTANILFSVELERRFAARGVHAYALHPGGIVTELGRHLEVDDFEVLRKRASDQGRELPKFKSVEAGAATTVWAATSPELADRGGVYLEDCHVSDNHAPWALNPDSSKRLWTVSEEMVGQTFSA
jgi:NAD(P)-dependent dehydrogenase (short-subunit alcohol dehydrogenase family)